MKKSKVVKKIACILCAMLLFSMMTACGGTKSSTATQDTAAAKTPDKTPEVPKSPLAPGEKVKIVAWYAISGASADAFNAQIAEFNSSQNEVQVEASYAGSYADAATKVSAALLSKTAPNVSLMSAGPLFTGANNDYTIAKLIEDPEFKKDDIFQGAWDYSKFNGKICAIPYGISTPVLYYNKKITDAAGIDPEKNPPKQWKDLLDMAKKCKELGNVNKSADFWEFDTSDAPWLFKSMLSQNGNTVIKVDDKGAVSPVYDDASAAEVAAFWKSLVDGGLMPAGEHANSEKRFLAGNLAFIVASSNRLSRWNTEKTITLNAVEMPYFKKQSVAMGGNVLVTFPKNTKEDYGSWKLIKFLASAEKQTDFAIKTGYLPIRKSGTTIQVAKDAIAANPLYKIAFKQLDYSWAYWHFNEMGTMDSILGSTLETIEKSKMAPDAALKDAAAQLKKEMKN